jgi:alpha-tubulin suppressor-like RCC1 family protein
LGENKPLTVALYPTGEGERAEASFTLTGEEGAPAGLKLVLEADRREIGEGQSAVLRAYGVDAKGQKVRLDPLRLNWSIDDPRFGRFDLDGTRPGDPIDWIKFNAHRILDDGRQPHFAVTYGDVVGVLDGVILSNGFVDVSAGGEHTCALRQFGDLSCWGLNDSGQLGIGTDTAPDQCFHTAHLTDFCSMRPMAVVGNHQFSAVSAGSNHVCALEKSTGAAFCWGNNVAGQTGVHTPVVAVVNAPTAVNPPSGSTTPLSFKSISAGTGITCAITTTNAEFCWGAGYGDTPRPANSGISGVTAVSAGSLFVCRLNAAGIFCEGPFGRPQTPPSQLGSWNVLGPAATAQHVCAIDSGGKTWCFGHSSNGKLGDGNTVNDRTEVLAPSPLNTVATGGEHSCGLSGTIAFCWGSNRNGQLGINNLNPMSSAAPLRVTSHPTTPSWVKISTGGRHTCALDDTAKAFCWGENHSAQLGLGTKIDFNANFPRQGHFGPALVVGQ